MDYSVLEIFEFIFNGFIIKAWYSIAIDAKTGIKNVAKRRRFLFIENVSHNVYGEAHVPYGCWARLKIRHKQVSRWDFHETYGMEDFYLHRKEFSPAQRASQ